jgi:hypothetical protein
MKLICKQHVVRFDTQQFRRNLDFLTKIIISNLSGSTCYISWTIAVRFPAGAKMGFFFFTFFTASIPALGPILPLVRWVPRYLTAWVKWLGREADNSASSSAEVKNERIYTSTPPIRLHGVVRNTAAGVKSLHENKSVSSSLVILCCR